jgi:ribosomal 30S subunit maturation factor RimM
MGKVKPREEEENNSVFGLPKVSHRKIAASKKKKVKPKQIPAIKAVAEFREYENPDEEEEWMQYKLVGEMKDDSDDDDDFYWFDNDGDALFLRHWADFWVDNDDDGSSPES